MSRLLKRLFADSVESNKNDRIEELNRTLNEMRNESLWKIEKGRLLDSTPEIK